MSLSKWVNDRVPISTFFQHHLCEYYVPKNLNIWYLFGVFSMVVLANQLISGFFLVMYYTPTEADAFSSIEFIMREVPYGWLIRYLHTTGASAFFIVIFFHIYRSIMYGSYRKPREILWLSGCILFLVLMAEAYTGYVLPWGQMSFWATKVIVSIIKLIPIGGESIAHWVMGDFSVSEVTLHRFFALHVILFPAILLLMVALHIVFLHCVGSNNPDGVTPRKKTNGIPDGYVPFHPYITIKDIAYVALFLFFFLAVVFYAPRFGGYFIEAENYAPANFLVTPAHIRPVWYLSPFFAILRSIPNQTLGAVSMLASLILLFALPWLDKSPVRSIRYKGPLCRTALGIFVLSFVGLGVVGNLSPSSTVLIAGQIFTVGYFSFFLLMPIYTKFDRYKKPPGVSGL